MKVNEALQKKQQKDFEENLSFAEWLDYFSKKPTSKELDDMEKESFKNQPQNNPYYQPLRGA